VDFKELFGKKNLEVFEGMELDPKESEVIRKFSEAFKGISNS
jgi:hypothetical protein